MGKIKARQCWTSLTEEKQCAITPLRESLVQRNCASVLRVITMMIHNDIYI